MTLGVPVSVSDAPVFPSATMTPADAVRVTVSESSFVSPMVTPVMAVAMSSSAETETGATTVGGTLMPPMLTVCETVWLSSVTSMSSVGLLDKAALGVNVRSAS